MKEEEKIVSEWHRLYSSHRKALKEQKPTTDLEHAFADLFNKNTWLKSYVDRLESNEERAEYYSFANREYYVFSGKEYIRRPEGCQWSWVRVGEEAAVGKK